MSDTLLQSPRVMHQTQRGAATLVVVVLLYLAMALIVVFTNRSLIFEQRTSANQYRSTQGANDTANSTLGAPITGSAMVQDPLGRLVFLNDSSLAPAVGQAYAAFAFFVQDGQMQSALACWDKLCSLPFRVSRMRRPQLAAACLFASSFSASRCRLRRLVWMRTCLRLKSRGRSPTGSGWRCTRAISHVLDVTA